MKTLKCSKFSNGNDIKIKWEIDGKINLNSDCIECNFKKLTTVNEKLNDLLNIVNYISNIVIVLFEMQGEKQKVKSLGLQRKEGRTILSSKCGICYSKSQDL